LSFVLTKIQFIMQDKKTKKLILITLILIRQSN